MWFNTKSLISTLSAKSQRTSQRSMSAVRVCTLEHYSDVIMGAMASQITGLTIVYLTVHSDADQRKKIKAPRYWPLWGEFAGVRNLQKYLTDDLVWNHCSDIIMNVMASAITGVSMVYSPICSGADKIKHQSSASLAFVRGIHRWPVNSPHKGPVTWKMFPFDDVIMMHKCSVPVTLEN